MTSIPLSIGHTEDFINNWLEEDTKREKQLANALREAATKDANAADLHGRIAILQSVINKYDRLEEQRAAPEQ